MTAEGNSIAGELSGVELDIVAAATARVWPSKVTASLAGYGAKVCVCRVVGTSSPVTVAVCGFPFRF